MARRALVAIIAAMCCRAAISCDSLADLMGRLSVDVAVPLSRSRSAFVSPALLRSTKVPHCNSRHVAPLACGREPSFSLKLARHTRLDRGHSTLPQSAFVSGGSFWAQAEGASRTRSMVSKISMRSPKSRSSASQLPTITPVRVEARPSHQVSVSVVIVFGYFVHRGQSQVAREWGVTVNCARSLSRAAFCTGTYARPAVRRADMTWERS